MEANEAYEVCLTWGIEIEECEKDGAKRAGSEATQRDRETKCKNKTKWKDDGRDSAPDR